MKVLLILSTVLALHVLHVACSHGSLLGKLVGVLKEEELREAQAEKREQAEMLSELKRALKEEAEKEQAKKREQEENAAVEKVVEALKSRNKENAAVEKVVEALKSRDAETLSELKRALKEEAEKEQAKKREQEENAAIENVVKALKSGNSKRFFDGISDFFKPAKEAASGVFDNAGDTAGNLWESIKDTVDGDSSEDHEQSKEIEDLDIPNDLQSGSTDACESPVLLNENGSGRIDFPGNDTYYESTQNCRWIINSTASGKKVKINFVRMDIDPKGCNDYVEVFSMDCNRKDGKFIGVPVTKKLCKDDINKLPMKERTVAVPNLCAYLHFRSNLEWPWADEGEGVGKGFKLEYTFV